MGSLHVGPTPPSHTDVARETLPSEPRKDLPHPSLPASIPGLSALPTHYLSLVTPTHSPPPKPPPLLSCPSPFFFYLPTTQHTEHTGEPIWG